MENLAPIFGKSAWSILKDMHPHIVSANTHTMTCDLVLSGNEYRVTRSHHRVWEVATEGYWQSFRSQWELLGWIGDRL